jgi:hypothetical protein
VHRLQPTGEHLGQDDDGDDDDAVVHNNACRLLLASDVDCSVEFACERRMADGQVSYNWELCFIGGDFASSK